MSEWSKEHDWKSCIPVKGYRGFESLSLHHTCLLPATYGVAIKKYIYFLIDSSKIKLGKLIKDIIFNLSGPKGSSKNIYIFVLTSLYYEILKRYSLWKT